MVFKKSYRKGKLLALLLIMALLMAQAVTPIFAYDGYAFLLKWGSPGTGGGEFTYPEGIAVDTDGNVYVADTQNNRTQKFDSKGNSLEIWTGGGEFQSPSGIAVDTSGNIYVANFYNGILKFDSQGNFLESLGSDGQFKNPSDVAVDAAGNVYVADTNNNCIQKFNSNGVFLFDWGSDGTGDGQFQRPNGVAVDADGNVYVADTNNHRIQKFNSKGDFLAEWGSQGSREGEFDQPQNVAVDAAGNVYVADTLNHRIQKFNSIGVFIVKWGSRGSSDGEFEHPYDLAVDAAGNVYVADTYNNRIQKFERENARGISVIAEVPQFQPILTFSITARTAPIGGSVSNSAIDFGALATETPKTGSHLLTVSTNTPGGYMVTAEENTALASGSNQIPDVTGDDEDITEQNSGAWDLATTYGFGYTLTGNDAAFTGGFKQFANIAKGKTTQVIMSNDNPVNNSQVEISYKLNIGPGQPAGNYSNTITYIITGNY